MKWKCEAHGHMEHMVVPSGENLLENVSNLG